MAAYLLSSQVKLIRPISLLCNITRYSTEINTRLPTLHQRNHSTTLSRMAPTVLGLGIPATSPMVPDGQREGLQKVLDFMESDMNSSPFDWDMFYVEADMNFNLVIEKLREKEWDVVMVGMGLRTAPPLTVFFEKVVNAAHKELPKTKLAFNVSIEKTQEACKRALEL